MKINKLACIGVIISFVVLTACTDQASSVASHLEKGEDFLNDGNYQKARIEFKNVLQIDNKNSKAFILLGKTEESEENWQRAFFSYSKAVSIDPDNIEAHTRLAPGTTVRAGRFDREGMRPPRQRCSASHPVTSGPPRPNSFVMCDCP